MARYNPYLHFRGNTEEAFNFYKSVLGGEFTRLMRYKDLPANEEYPLAEAHRDKIMFIALPLDHGNTLLGSDAILESAERTFTMGDNFHIAISAETKAEADRLFHELSAGGQVEVDVPISDSPWETYFGMFVDKFGVQWVVEFDPNNRE